MVAGVTPLGVGTGALALVDDGLRALLVEDVAGTELAATVTMRPVKVPVRWNVAVAPLNAPPTMVAVQDMV